MAMLAITGLQGSGKGHQVVKYFIPENYAKGRNIRTNVKGLKLDLIKEYCIKKFPSLDPEKFGKIEFFEESDMKKENFFPILINENNTETIDDSNSIIKSGDVVIIDEAHRAYGDSLKKEELEYFTMHRHFIDLNGFESEIVLMTQDISLLTAKVRKLIKNTYECRKMDAVGRSDKYYMAVYTGGTTNKRNRILEDKKLYDKEIFTLYESQEGGKGKSMSLDKRVNLMRSPRMIGLFLAIIIAPILLIYTLWNFFHPKPKVDATTSASTLNQSGAAQPAPQPIENLFKIVGVLDTPKKRLIFLQDQNQTIKLMSPKSCTGSGMLLTCRLDNDKEVSYYTNIKPNTYNGLNNENKNKTNYNTNSQPINNK